MGTMASQNTSLPIVYSTFYSGADQGKHQSSASLAFERGIHRWPVNSPHKWPFDDVIMKIINLKNTLKNVAVDGRAFWTRPQCLNTKPYLFQWICLQMNSSILRKTDNIVCQRQTSVTVLQSAIQNSCLIMTKSQTDLIDLFPWDPLKYIPL